MSLPRPRAGYQLGELLIALALFTLVAGLVLTALVTGHRALADGRRALTLCLTAAALDREIRSASVVVEPLVGRSADRLILRTASRRTSYEVEGNDLVATSAGVRRVLARGVDAVVFLYRGGRGGIVRYFLDCDGAPLLSASPLGVAP